MSYLLIVLLLILGSAVVILLLGIAVIVWVGNAAHNADGTPRREVAAHDTLPNYAQVQ